MTATVPTPFLDKAASEELTSSEIQSALAELTALDPDQRRFDLHVTKYGVEVYASKPRIARHHDSVEDALGWQHDELLEIIAEIEADAS